VTGIYTNTTQVDAYRGAGRPEAIYVLERAMDYAARALGIDAWDFRRRNFIAPEKFPYKTASRVRYDVGDFGLVLDRLAQEAARDDFEARRAASAQKGLLRGLGLCCYIESILGNPTETSRVVFQADGSVDLYVGTQSGGQGHETVYAQYLADQTGLPVELAREAGQSALLDVTQSATLDDLSFPNGAHLAEVEVDPQTGQSQVVRYVIVDDFGYLLNPMLVEGQVHGGVVQGLGQAMMEHVVYDDNGQLLTASFMDYGMPRAADVPMFDFNSVVVPSTANPIGMKGCGEAGTIGSMAAVSNAVMDALASQGVTRADMPFTPQRVWSMLQNAG
jgi:carbon-monoxide dehydrogenase large subunit